jgi:hypothetical protein
MDRYLFRGKRVDNGEWVQGCLYYFNLESNPQLPIRTIMALPNTLIDNENEFDADPATIGQCTGLRDKNGTLIFEGDIVTCGEQAGIISWNNSENGYPHLCWVIYYKSHIRPIHKDTTCEIIGNVHDHPHLIVSINDNVIKIGRKKEA